FELNKDEGTTLIIVTHDRELASKCNRIIELKSGSIISDTTSPVEETETIQADLAQ
ncbi:MAG: ABC transporter, partial [Bacteroidetes bacterium]|nr:ABC transporter [Bacteroidota bacterium]